METKKIVVFGGTGGTGKEAIRQALEKGYAVTAILRQPDAFTIQHPQLTILQGDVLQPVTFEKELTGADAVLSCLGSGRSTAPTTVYSTGTENIITAMNKAGVKRLLCISAGALYANKEMGWFVRTLTKLVLQKILKEPYADMRRMEKIVATSNLNWMVVRPARLTDEKFTGHYRSTINENMVRPWKISRADVAHFMLTNIDNPKTFKAITELAY